MEPHMEARSRCGFRKNMGSLCSPTYGRTQTLCPLIYSCCIVYSIRFVILHQLFETFFWRGRGVGGGGNIYAYMLAYMHTCKFKWKHMCIYAYMLAYMQICKRIWTHICIYAGIYAYMQVYITSGRQTEKTQKERHKECISSLCCCRERHI